MHIPLIAKAGERVLGIQRHLAVSPTSIVRSVLPESSTKICLQPFK